MTELKAVLFDIDDTLFSTTEFASKARGNAVRAMMEAGLRGSEAELTRELGEVISEFSSNYGQHFNKLLMRLPEGAYAGVNTALIVAAGIVAYHDTKFRELEPFSDVVPLLSALRAAGVRAGIVTHGLTSKQSEKLIRLGIVPHLDTQAVFISEQVGISKPNPKLYAAALRSMWLEPHQVMYVGDNLANDVAPPKQLGIRTVWTRRAARAGQDESIGPDHVVDDFQELAGILREEYCVSLPELEL